MRAAAGKLLEIVRAFSVLALVFLNFGHAPVFADQGAAAVSATIDAGYCGAPADDPREHAPCHACRIGGSADLPPACGPAAPAFEAAAIDFDFAEQAAAMHALAGDPRARAPPAI